MRMKRQLKFIRMKGEFQRSKTDFILVFILCLINTFFSQRGERPGDANEAPAIPGPWGPARCPGLMLGFSFWVPGGSGIEGPSLGFVEVSGRPGKSVQGYYATRWTTKVALHSKSGYCVARLTHNLGIAWLLFEFRDFRGVELLFEFRDIVRIQGFHLQTLIIQNLVSIKITTRSL